MFGFGNRKKQSEVNGLVRRLMDASNPNIPPPEGDLRWEDRSGRTLPVLLAPFENRRPTMDEAAFAVTKNLSSQGLALVLPQPFRAAEVVIGLWVEADPLFLLGQVRQNVPLGGGFWQLGLELAERLSIQSCHELEALLPLAVRLKPEPHRAPRLPAGSHH
jgi:hypothetical protein